MRHFSVLDSRTGEWRQRSKWWLDTFAIQSELGRANLNMFNPRVSQFDPTLAETFYKWYTPEGGSILDPFAGGSVRGIVAHELGYKYTGIELRQEQVDANREQSDGPQWICGDSKELLPLLEDDYDFIFTCPPYHNLEIYSDLEADLSQMDWEEFKSVYSQIMKECYAKLKPNRFMAIVIGEVREKPARQHIIPSFYRGLVSEATQMAQAAGFGYYNEYILLQNANWAGLREDRMFKINRKVPLIHQHILVFCKGHPDIATLDIDGHTHATCTVDGVPYRSMREVGAAFGGLDLDVVKRRFSSRKKKWETWQLL